MRYPHDHRPAPRPAWVLIGCLAALAVLVATYTAFALTAGSGRAMALLPAMGMVIALLAGLALHSAEAFVLVALGIRSSLDVLKLGSGAPAGADPAQLLSVGFIVLALLWLFLQRRSTPPCLRPGLSPVGLALLAFLGAAGLGVLISPDPVASAVEWSRIASVAAMFFVVERIARRPRSRERLVLAVFVAVPIPLFVAAQQALTGTGLFSAGGFDRVRGTFTHSNPFAAFLTVVLLLGVAMLFTGRWRLPLRVGLCVGLAAVAVTLLATYTRGAWIAAVVGLVIVLMQVRRSALLVLAVGVTALAVLVPSVLGRFADLQTDTGQNSLSWRWEYWTDALALSSDSPLSGVGLRQVLALTPEGQQPHNDFIRAFVEMGVLGILTYTVLLGTLVVTAARVCHRTRHDVGGTDRGLAVAFSGVVGAVLTMSVAANLMSQVVVLWYVYALAGAASALLSTRRPLDRPDAAVADTAASEAPAAVPEGRA